MLVARTARSHGNAAQVCCCQLKVAQRFVAGELDGGVTGVLGDFAQCQPTRQRQADGILERVAIVRRDAACAVGAGELEAAIQDRDIADADWARGLHAALR